MVLFVAAILAAPAMAEDAAPCANANSQMELNSCAAEEAKQAEAEMEKRYAEVSAQTEGAELLKKLALSQATWEAYRDAQCDFDAAQFEGGSIRPMIYHLCRATSAKQRAEALNASKAEAK